MSKKVIGFISVLVVIVIGIIVVVNVQEESTDIDYDGQPFIGEESASVDIVEFGDYQCPHCKDFNESVFPVINQELVETGKAKFYYMHYPVIGPESTSAAKLAESVYHELGSDTFWDFHHLLFENQTTESGDPNKFTDDFMKAILEEVASSDEVEQVMDAYNDNKWDEDFEKDVSTANNLGVETTPSIYIDGKLFKGESMEEFMEAVEEASASDK